jgi:diaminopimelate epimerase
MQIDFSKYQGTGNDFVVIDNRSGGISLNKEQIIAICDRRFGVGSDGIILIEKDHSADFYMNFYNPDGSQSFCGNGSRCAVKFASQFLQATDLIKFRAIDGWHEARINGHDINIRMKDINTIEVIDGHTFFIQTGSPHHIIYQNNIGEVDLVKEARKIRYSEKYGADGVNVNYVQPNGNELLVRTYERGVEDETYSCGTGVTAVALSFGFLHPEFASVQVATKGGVLKVGFKNNGKGNFTDIWLSGPATFVFEGKINID